MVYIHTLYIHIRIYIYSHIYIYMYYILIKWQFAGYPCFFRDPMGFRHDQLVHGRQESTHVTDHSDVETLESCSSRPLSPCRARTAGMDGEIGSGPANSKFGENDRRF